MPPSQLNINELYRMQKKRNEYKMISFEKILELCHKRIKTVATYGGLNTFYEIPGLLIGYPLYKISECMNYIIEQLRKNGLLVQILNQNTGVLFISWDPTDIKKPNKQLSIGNQNQNKNNNTFNSVPSYSKNNLLTQLPVPPRRLF